MMEDVRDPHKWRKFLLKMADRAAELASRSRSERYLFMDLGVGGDTVAELSAMHGAIYKLCRVGRTRRAEINRKEIVNLYNLVIYGPKELRVEAYKVIWRISDD